jgi:hypothetical protein
LLRQAASCGWYDAAVACSIAVVITTKGVCLAVIVVLEDDHVRTVRAIVRLPAASGSGWVEGSEAEAGGSAGSRCGVPFSPILIQLIDLEDLPGYHIRRGALVHLMLEALAQGHQLVARHA